MVRHLGNVKRGHSQGGAARIKVLVCLLKIDEKVFEVPLHRQNLCALDGIILEVCQHKL